MTDIRHKDTTETQTENQIHTLELQESREVFARQGKYRFAMIGEYGSHRSAAASRFRAWNR